MSKKMNLVGILSVFGLDVVIVFMWYTAFYPEEILTPMMATIAGGLLTILTAVVLVFNYIMLDSSLAED